MTDFLGLRPQEKTAIFIDGANLYKSARGLGFDIDYKSLLERAQAGSRLIRASYYTAMQEDRDQDFSPLRPLIDWLDYNGYAMVTKPSREFTDQNGRKRYKGSTDIELATDLLLLAPRMDHLVIFSGNGDFRRAIEAAQGLGARVTVVSTTKSSPPMASDELRRQADRFIELADLEEQIGRVGGPSRRAARDDDDDYYDEDDEDAFDEALEDVD